MLYARVSSQRQRADLNPQEELLERYAMENGYQKLVRLKDIASGLNVKGLGLNPLLST